MNPRSKLLIFLIYSLVLFGLFIHQRIFLIAGIPLLVYLAAGIFFEPPEILLKAERSLSSDRVKQGDPVSIQLQVTNLGHLIENIIIEDLVPNGIDVFEGAARITTTLKPGESTTLTYSLRGSRGLIKIPGIQTTTRDHLGLFPKQKSYELAHRIMVVPRAFALPEVPIRPQRTRVHPGLIPSRKGGQGIEFFGVREYHPGDPRRLINHRLSARQENILYINEFEQERAVDVGLILDCRVETNLFRGNRELLEYNIQAAATMAESFLNYGNRVGLFIYGGGRNWVHPGYGKQQREKILQTLAGVRLYDHVVSKELSNLPTRLFPARSQLVIISSLLYKDLPTIISLRAHGYPLLVISPDAVDFEHKIIGNNPTILQAVRLAQLERQYILRQIQRTGANVFDWKVDQPFHQFSHTMLPDSLLWQRGQVVEYD